MSFHVLTAVGFARPGDREKAMSLLDESLAEFEREITSQRTSVAMADRAASVKGLCLY